MTNMPQTFVHTLTNDEHVQVAQEGDAKALLALYNEADRLRPLLVGVERGKPGTRRQEDGGANEGRETETEDRVNEDRANDNGEVIQYFFNRIKRDARDGMRRSVLER